MDGPPPYSPVDIEQTLLVSCHADTQETRTALIRREQLCSSVSPSRDEYFLSGANDPWTYYSPIKAEHVIQAMQHESPVLLGGHISHLFFHHMESIITPHRI